MKSILFLFFALLNPQWVQAQSDLTWKAEQLKVIEGQREVQITFKATKAGTILKDKKQIVHVTTSREMKMLESDILDDVLPVEVDKGGEKSIVITLPPGILQVPILFESEGQQSPMIINLRVDLRATFVQKNDTALSTKEMKLWLGIGATYLRYNQEGGVQTKPLTFVTTKVPSFAVSGDLGLSKNVMLTSFITIAPGSVESSDTFQVKDENYNWIIYGFEGVHYPNFLTWNDFRLGYRLGAQIHHVPFISREMDGRGKLQNNAIGNLSVGPMLFYGFSPHWSMESYFRIQQPIFNGTLFSIKPKLSFDGLVSLVYRPNTDGPWYFGLFWFGQSFNFDYTFTDLQLQADTNGSMSLFFSILDFRVGYRF